MTSTRAILAIFYLAVSIAVTRDYAAPFLYWNCQRVIGCVWAFVAWPLELAAALVLKGLR